MAKRLDGTTEKLKRWIPQDEENRSLCDGLIHLRDGTGRVRTAICEGDHPHQIMIVEEHGTRLRMRASDRLEHLYRRETLLREYIVEGDHARRRKAIERGTFAEKQSERDEARGVYDAVKGRAPMPEVAREAFATMHSIEAEVERRIPKSEDPPRPAGHFGTPPVEAWRRATRERTLDRLALIQWFWWERERVGPEPMSGPPEILFATESRSGVPVEDESFPTEFETDGD